MPVPQRFEIEYFNELEARATDVGSGEYLGNLSAGPAESQEGAGKHQIISDHNYGPVRAFLIRDPSPDLGHVVVGIIEGLNKTQEVVVIGQMVHYLGTLAEGCAANLSVE